MRTDYATVGRPLTHETGCGFFYSDTLRAEFRDDRNLMPRREFGCLDAAETIPAGSHMSDNGHPVAEFVFR